MRWQILWRSKPGLAGVAILTTLTLMALFAPWIVPYEAEPTPTAAT